MLQISARGNSNGKCQNLEIQGILGLGFFFFFFFLFPASGLDAILILTSTLLPLSRCPWCPRILPGSGCGIRSIRYALSWPSRTISYLRQKQTEPLKRRRIKTLQAHRKEEGWVQTGNCPPSTCLEEPEGKKRSGSGEYFQPRNSNLKQPRRP